MAKTDFSSESRTVPESQKSPFPKPVDPANLPEPETDRIAAETGPRETGEPGEAIRNHIRHYQDASTDAMTDIAQSVVRAVGEMARGVRRAMDRF